MLELLGPRQKDLLTLLLRNKSGMTVDEISQPLGITRNAVRQHLAALQLDGLVAIAASRASGGRPEQLYALTDKGKELFPRQYSLLAQLIVESLEQESGAKALGQRLRTMGANVAAQLRSQHPDLQTPQQRVLKLSELMEQLGYNTGTSAIDSGGETIEADNCAFHNLAAKNPAVCDFDLALLTGFTRLKVDHEEFLVRGGQGCRFRFVCVGKSTCPAATAARTRKAHTRKGFG